MLGPARLDLAEEVVQDAMVRALATWPHQGIPDNPRGWLFRTARNRALDLLRREGAFADKLAPVLVAEGEADGARDSDGASGDDELAMVFMCCHPALPRAGRVALTLKTVGGFGVEEIAAALLARPDAVAQRLVRVKRQLRDEAIPLEMPSEAEMSARLGTVLEVLYLLFNEGYGAHAGDSLVRAELCGEAIRLARLLADAPRTALPSTHALLALFLLQASRLPAREDEAGDLLLLSAQDRARWDRGLIAEGMRHFALSAAGREVTPYHVEAAIAAAHAAAPDPESTDWRAVLRLYDDLLALKPSPVVALNRAVALAMVDGPDAGIRALKSLRGEASLARYHLLPATLGALHLRAGRSAEAARHYRDALALPCSAPERRFLERQAAACEASHAPNPGA
jgi:RNA polymerase sigma-70 factor (ECF subfamily)